MGRGLGLCPGGEAMGPAQSLLLPSLFRRNSHVVIRCCLRACITWSLVFGSSPVPLHAAMLSVRYLACRPGVGASPSVSPCARIGWRRWCAPLEPLLAQSGLLLPEVMLAWRCTLALLGYVQR